MRIPATILSFAISLLLVLLGADAYAQTYNWVRGGATGQFFTPYNFQEELLFSCTDPNGNYYALSIVGNTAIVADTFSRPTGGYGSAKNVLFTSHSCSGQMRFAKLLSCQATTPCGIVSDGGSKLYLAVDMPHNGPTSAHVLRLGYDTSFATNQYQKTALIQYDTTGDFGWIRFVGADLLSTYAGTGGIYNYVAMDGSGNPHLIAITKNGVQLTPSLISQKGYYDHTFDASGNLLDVKKLDIDTTLLTIGLTIDKQSNKMYAYGYRDYSAYPAMTMFPYLTALDINRNRIWLDTFTNPYFAQNAGISGIVADGYGHLYITPNAPRCFVFRTDTMLNTLITSGTSKVTGVMKLDTAGNVLWKKIFSGNTGVNSLLRIVLLPNNKVATGGVTGGKVVCGSDTVESYAGEGQNASLVILDTAGYLHKFDQLHGLGFYDYTNSLAADHKGNLYLGGKLESNIWAGALTPYSTVGGDSDYFIMKYGVDCGCTAMPVANYTYTGTGLTRSLTYTGTTAGIDSVRWSFGDGGTSTALAPTHTYTAAGTYTTCVRVYSPCGNDMRCYEVTVACTALPTAAHIDTGNAVRGFTYTGTTTPYYDSVRWSFGDGSADTGLHTLHTYAAAGTYTVCAVVYTRCGTDTACRAITVTTVTVTTLQPQPDVIQAYPNPSAGNIIITGITQPTTYQLHNAVGHTVAMGAMAAGPNQLNIASLSPGIYLLEMQTQTGQRVVLRVMKQ
jgi:PKD repeat protein